MAQSLALRRSFIICSRTRTLPGASIAIDGPVLIAGSPVGFPRVPGLALLYLEPSGGWTNKTESLKIPAPGPEPGFGTSVAVSGSTLAIGSPHTTVSGNSHEGAVYVFGP